MKLYAYIVFNFIFRKKGEAKVRCEPRKPKSTKQEKRYICL